MKKLFLAAAALLLLLSGKAGAQTWNSTIGNDYDVFTGYVGNHMDRSFDTTLGGAFIVLGQSNFAPGIYGSTIIRVSNHGDSLWRVDYPLTNASSFRCATVQLTSTGGVVAGGYAELPDSSLHYYIYAYDNTGQQTAFKDLPVGRDSHGWFGLANDIILQPQVRDDIMYTSSMLRTGNSTLLALKYTNTYGPSTDPDHDTALTTSVIYKMDAQLNTLWADTIANAPGRVDAQCIQGSATSLTCSQLSHIHTETIYPTVDGGFGIVIDSIQQIYTQYNFTTAPVLPYIAKYNAAGQQLWKTPVPYLYQLQGILPLQVDVSTHFNELFLVGTADSGLLVGASMFPGNINSSGFDNSNLYHLNGNGIVTDTLALTFAATQKSLLSAWLLPNSDIRFFTADAMYKRGLLTLDRHLQFKGYVPDINVSNSSYRMWPNNIGGATALSWVDGFIGPIAHITNFDSLGNIAPARIEGHLTYDLNGNCTNDAGDLALNNRIVTLTDSVGYQYHGISNADGSYYVNGPTGIYTLTTGIDANKHFVCPSTGAINLFAPIPAATYWGNDFYENMTPGITNLSLHSYINHFVPGFLGSTYTVQVQNTGSVPVTATLTLNPDAQVNVVSTTPVATGNSGGLYTFPVTALQPDSTVTFTVNMQTPASLPLNTPLGFAASIPVPGDANPFDNADTLNTTVIGAFDPNEKLVNRPLHVNGDCELVYTVAFQNTGTYSAKDVVVEDSLDSRLDMSTFRLLGASTAAMPAVSVRDGNALLFRFDNIYLPDSNTNEAASHGSFTYAVRLKPTAQIGDSIRNKAFIYFDYNAPIITNTTLNILSTAPTPAGIAGLALSGISVYPNPATDRLTITLPAGATGNWQLQLTDMAGRTIWQRTATAANGLLNVPQTAPTGAYLLHITNTATGQGVIRKIMVR